MSLRKVEVVPYSNLWPELFEQEAGLLRLILGNIVLGIHHIGSTSVKNLVAKPIIDLLIEVSSLNKLDEHNFKMQSIGYEAKGEFGIPGRRYYPKGGLDRTHHVHAFQSGDAHVFRHLAFRDYLRANPLIAQEYGQLKIDVANSCGNDLGRYCDGKDEYIKKIELDALKTYGT
jgi:GrpB-like predicted nucleotidyltransferase (UPF0157 family)